MAVVPPGNKQAVVYQVNAMFGNHIYNMQNPHQTTAAQVGLGNLRNLLMATQADAEAGTVEIAGKLTYTMTYY